MKIMGGLRTCAAALARRTIPRMKPFSLHSPRPSARDSPGRRGCCFALLMHGRCFCGSVDRIHSERRRRASEEDSLWAVDRLSSFFEMRLESLRRISQFYLYTEDLGVPVVGGEEVSRMELRRRDFEGFSQELLDEVPGFLAVIVTDRDGIPKWIAPHDRLPMETVTVMASDPVLMRAFRSLPSGPVVSEPLPLIGHGDGFAIGCRWRTAIALSVTSSACFRIKGCSIACPSRGARAFQLRIAHGNRLVYPLVPVSSACRSRPTPACRSSRCSGAAGGWRSSRRSRFHASRSSVSLAGWARAVSCRSGVPDLPLAAAAAQLQSEARESRSRLEHTGRA